MVCALYTSRLISTWPPAPLLTAWASPDVSALGRSQSAAAVEPRPMRVVLVSALAPPLPARARDDKSTPLWSPRRLTNTGLTGLPGGTPREPVRHCSAPEDSLFVFSSLNSYLFPGTVRSRDMSRKRHRLVPEPFGLKRRRERGDVEVDSLRGESGSARAAVAELVRLFPRVLFEDALPPIVLRSQVYSLVPDRTVADLQLVRGVRATDEKRLLASRALPMFPITHSVGRPAILPFSKRWVFLGQTLCQALWCQGECCRPSSSREHAKS